MADMETIVANVVGKTRRATFGGRRYLVAPLVLLNPGVLNGSRGPLYYPPEEVGRDPSIWNFVPITDGHPLVNGQPSSARDPDVLEKHGMGYVFHAHFDGKLRAEGWFEEEATRRVNPRVWNALESNTPFDLSTGVFTDNAPAANGASHNGKPYIATARNYRSDHVATLVNGRGACSLDDGCGVLVNADAAEVPHPGVSLAKVKKIMADAEKAEEKGEGKDEKKPTGNAEDVAEEKKGLFRRLGEMLGLVQPAETSHSDVTTENATSDHQPSDDLEISAKKSCVILHDGEVHGHPLTDPQRKMFAAKCDEDKTDSAATDNQDVSQNQLSRGGTVETTTPATAPTDNHQGTSHPDVLKPCDQETTPMPTPRETNVAWLTANCDCFTDKASVLNSPDTFTDADLARIRAKVEESKRKDAALATVQNALGIDLVNNAAATEDMMAKCKKMMADEETAEGEPTGNARRTTSARPLTMNEWLSTMPADAKPIWNRLVESEERERQALISQITANIDYGSDEERAADLADLQREPADSLRKILRRQGNRGNTHQQGVLMPSYLGAAALPPAQYRLTDNEANDVLDLESIRAEQDAARAS